MEAVKRAAAYIRVSKAEQVTKGLSLENQEAVLKDYIIRNGMKFVDIYADKGITARKKLNRRKEFVRLMNDVDKGIIDQIVVLRLDRWFRNVYDYHRMMNEHLIPNNVSWCAVNEDYDTSTTNGRLMINLRLAIAEQECDTDSDRIKDIFSNRINNGFVVSGSVPIGYKIENKRLVKDENKEQLITDIFDTFNSNHSIRQTMEDINTRYGLSILYNTYYRIFKNELFMGKNREVLDYCPAYITEAQFNENQRILKMNVRTRETRNEYIFSSLLRCNCGASMVGLSLKRKNTSYVYYRCCNKIVNKTCDMKYVREDYIEQYLLENIKPKLTDYIEEKKVEAKAKKKLKDNTTVVEKKLSRLDRLYIMSDMADEVYKKRRAEILATLVRKEDIPNEIDTSKVEIFLDLDLTNIYKDLKVSEKRYLWRNVVKQVIIRDGKIIDIVPV